MRKILLTILIGMILISLVNAESITLNNRNYEITNVEKEEYIGFCLDLDNGVFPSPCSTYITGEYIEGNEIEGTQGYWDVEINETALMDLNHTIFCWENNCTPEMSPFYVPEVYMNNSGSIIIADGYITNTPSNSQIKEKIYDFIINLNESTPILTEEGNLNTDLLFSHEVTNVGSWFVDAIAFTNRVWNILNSLEIKELRKENNAFKSCLQSETDYQSYRQCVGGFLS